MKKAKMKRPILGIKKDSIVELVKDNGSSYICLYDNQHVRIDKRHLEILKK